MKSIIKDTANKKIPARIASAIFLLIVTSFGFGLLNSIAVEPIKKVLDAKSWPMVRCKIIKAEMKPYTDSEGHTEYEMVISYEYKFNGNTYKSNQYNFMESAFRTHVNEENIVSYYKKVPASRCFVNPDDPSEAVIKRGYQIELVFSILPLLMIGYGIIGTYKKVFVPAAKKAVPSRKQCGRQSAPGDFTRAESGMKKIKSKSPFIPLLKTIGFAAFFDGIATMAIFHLLNKFYWVGAIVLIPFVLIGLFYTAFAAMYFLMIFNPRSRVRLSTVNVRPGKLINMHWKFSGRTSILRNLKITLRAKEITTYTCGSSTQTSTNVFHQTEIFATNNPNEIPVGDISFAIPERSIHSFDSTNNKIEWEIAPTGEIKSWPDVNQTYIITVLP